MASPQDSKAASPSQVLETIQLDHVPSTHTVHVGVFKDVANSEFLHQQLLSRNTDFEYAFIDASSVRVILSCSHTTTAPVLLTCPVPYTCMRTNILYNSAYNR